jgi:hypothetical protein
MLPRLGVPVALSGITTAAVTGGAITAWRWPWKTTVLCTSRSRALWIQVPRLSTDQTFTQLQRPPGYRFALARHCLDAGTLRVQITRTLVATTKGLEVVEKGPKSASDKRSLPLPQQVAVALRSFKAL